jgi:hypothetical protein
MKELTTYLMFDGNCRQAMTFYGKCFGADVQILPFSESPCPAPPDAKDRVMHANLRKGSPSRVKVCRRLMRFSLPLAKTAKSQCHCKRRSGQLALGCSRISLESTGCSISKTQSIAEG